jgi:hypothetical protein
MDLLSVSFHYICNIVFTIEVIAIDRIISFIADTSKKLTILFRRNCGIIDITPKSLQAKEDINNKETNKMNHRLEIVEIYLYKYLVALLIWGTAYPSSLSKMILAL